MYIRASRWDALIHEIKARNGWESPITRDYLVGGPYHKGLLMSRIGVFRELSTTFFVP